MKELKQKNENEGTRTKELEQKNENEGTKMKELQGVTKKTTTFFFSSLNIF